MAEARDIDIAEYVRAAGLKLTPQRLAIVRELVHDPTHPTAQELYERLLPAMPSMSFATVYNTLDALASRGLCSVRAMSPGPSRFDPNMIPHDHAVCDECGMVRDVEPRAPARKAQIEAKKIAAGFVVRSVEQVYRGLCSDCAAKKPSTSSTPKSDTKRR